tara:strand:+ start:368 stop:628 length:261 start_codon:yes stop_codon:yes gene_type:complete
MKCTRDLEWLYDKESKCENEDNPEDMWCPEFNAHLCDDCYTEYRRIITGLLDFNQSDDLYKFDEMIRLGTDFHNRKSSIRSEHDSI